ncbi:hypothetical protein P8452_29014 [Trifolium repens]|nr:hypothetical protein P8452_29014 [Trifolium repens]
MSYIAEQLTIRSIYSTDGEVLSVKFTHSFLASQYQEEWPLFDGILYFSAYLEKYSSLKGDIILAKATQNYRWSFKNGCRKYFPTRQMPIIEDHMELTRHPKDSFYPPRNCFQIPKITHWQVTGTLSNSSCRVRTMRKFFMFSTCF